MFSESIRDKKILNRELKNVEEEFARILMRIPRRNDPPQEPSAYWLHLQIIERYCVLEYAHIVPGSTVVEIGCGSHAITTVPLAYKVEETGRVCAVDISRWGEFDRILQAATLRRRVMPLWCDATQLPVKSESFDLAVSIHGVRSIRNEDTIVSIFKEMLRVSPHLFVAASLPIAKTRAQKAHLEMYNLREEIFEALSGRKDDIHYFSLEKLTEFVVHAGGTITETNTVDTGLPHHLAVLPREFVEKIKDEEKKECLLERWEIAFDNLLKYGEEQPPVGIIEAVRQ